MKALSQKNASFVQLSSSQELTRRKFGGENSEMVDKKCLCYFPKAAGWHYSRLHYTGYAFVAPGFLVQLNFCFLSFSNQQSGYHPCWCREPYGPYSKPIYDSISLWASWLSIYSEIFLCISASFHIVDFSTFTCVFFHFLFQAWLSSYNYMFEAWRWIPCDNTFYHIYLKTIVSSCQLTYGSICLTKLAIFMKNPLFKESNSHI